jgi:hypothetical protein
MTGISSSINSTSSLNSLYLPSPTKIDAKVFVNNLKAMKETARTQQAEIKNMIANSSCHLSTLALKQKAIFLKNEVDFADKFIKKISKSEASCDALYDDYQHYLDDHPKLKRINFYQFTKLPELFSPFIRQHTSQPKQVLRSLNSTLLNNRSHDNNARIFREL